MKLTVLSSKRCWPGPDGGYVTVGGFPIQMRSLSSLFERTTLVLSQTGRPRPQNMRPLQGKHLQVAPIPEPSGQGFLRKLALLYWLPSHLPRLWKIISQADVVHTPVPGDIGTIGILLALLQRKRLFVRHCGTWGDPGTLADRVLLWLLERIAGGRTVVLATGGGPEPPSRRNPHINWIFSTTLRAEELDRMQRITPWTPERPLHLVTVGRLTPTKNTASIIRALPLLNDSHDELCLSVVGEGECLQPLKALAEELGVSERVDFHGNVSHDEVLRVLSRAHVFVFPTRTKEGFPKAVLEALACGLPVITTPVSILPHLIDDRCGFVLEKGTPEDIADAIQRLVAAPHLYERFSSSAVATAQPYSLERWTETIRERLEAAWGPLNT